MKYLILFLLTFFTGAVSQEKKIEWKCIKWYWIGDVYDRKVYCLEWKKVEKK